jgi:hypothetical protein
MPFTEKMDEEAKIESLTDDEAAKDETELHVARVMVFNATFNNISAISWPSVL